MLLRMSSIGFPVAVSALVLGAFAGPAHAYLDPGTGSMILQLLLGGVAGAAVAGRFYWDKLLTLLRLRPAKQQSETSDEATASPTRHAD